MSLTQRSFRYPECFRQIFVYFIYYCVSQRSQRWLRSCSCSFRNSNFVDTVAVAFAVAAAVVVIVAVTFVFVFAFVVGISIVSGLLVQVQWVITSQSCACDGNETMMNELVVVKNDNVFIYASNIYYWCCKCSCGNCIAGPSTTHEQLWNVTHTQRGQELG